MTTDPQIQRLVDSAYPGMWGVIALCELLVEKGILDTADVSRVHQAMVKASRNPSAPVEPVVERARQRFDEAFQRVFDKCAKSIAEQRP